ncbi:hypothetical protein HZH68_013694 [Vespula germanica]|uniref:Uncharacterized protein n=1 Tax=Vespula germanica TaxID=30212 RepID=A0A834MVK6_VESGE|nr:hypothetical protein HZH68_013694 [Vespula germanica]
MQEGHDRSCLEISEADGVDGGAICKRGFTQHHFAEKPEAPEAERHLGSWILETKWSSGGALPTKDDTLYFDTHAFPQVVTEGSRDAPPTKEDTEVIYSTARRPPIQIYLQFRHACVSARRNGEVRVLSPPRRTPKLYIPQPDGPRFRSTYNFDLHAFPQGEVEKWESSPHQGGHRSFIFHSPTALASDLLRMSTCMRFRMTKWRSGGALPTKEDTEVIYSTARRPPLQINLQFRHACVSASKNDEMEKWECSPHQGGHRSYIFHSPTAPASDQLTISTRMCFRKKKREDLADECTSHISQYAPQKYKAAAFDTSHATNFHHSHFNARELHLEILTSECQYNTTLYLTFRVGPLGEAQGFYHSGVYRHERTSKLQLDATGASIDDDFTQVQCGITHIFDILYFFFCYRSPLFIFGDFDNISGHVDLEISAGCYRSESPLCTFGDSDNISGRVDLEISAGCHGSESPLCTFGDSDNISGRVDLDISAGGYRSESPPCTFGDSDNGSGRVDLEISAGCNGSESPLCTFRDFANLSGLRLKVASEGCV